MSLLSFRRPAREPEIDPTAEALARVEASLGDLRNRVEHVAAMQDGLSAEQEALAARIDRLRSVQGQALNTALRTDGRIERAEIQALLDHPGRIESQANLPPDLLAVVRAWLLDGLPADEEGSRS